MKEGGVPGRGLAVQSPVVGGILAQHPSTEALKKVLRARGEGERAR